MAEEVKKRVGRPANARLRAAPVREEPVREDIRDEAAPTKRLSRRRRVDNPFDIDPKLQPNGVTYEWKREAVFGQPDPQHMINLRENGWTQVPASRHPHLVANVKDGVIRQGGQILMERPAYLTEEARQEDFQIAKEQVQSLHHQVNEAGPGQFTRDHESVRKISRIKQTYERPMQVED